MAQPLLTSEEVEFIMRGFRQWGGPARPSAAFAQSFGFESVEDLRTAAEQLRRTFQSRDELTKEEWALILRLTQAIVTDDANGAGWEWPTVAGYTESETSTLLASVRETLGAISND